MDGSPPLPPGLVVVTGQDTPCPEKQPQRVCFGGACPLTPAQVNAAPSSASLGALCTGASRLLAPLSASPGLLWSGGLAIPARGSSSPWGPVFVEDSGPCQPIFLSTLSPRPPSLLLWSRGLSCPPLLPTGWPCAQPPSQLRCVSAWLSSSPPGCHPLLPVPVSRLSLAPGRGRSSSASWVWTCSREAHPSSGPCRHLSGGTSCPGAFLVTSHHTRRALSLQEFTVFPEPASLCCPVCCSAQSRPPPTPQGRSVRSSSCGQWLSPGVHGAAAAPCSAIRAGPLVFPPLL